MNTGNESDAGRQAEGTGEGARLCRKGGGRSFKRLDQVLNSVVSKLALDARLREHTLLGLWPVVAGEEWARRSRGLFVDAQGNLVVAVADAATGQELSLLKPQVLARLRPAARCLGLSVTGLRFDLKHFHGRSEDRSVPDPSGRARLPSPTQADLAGVSLLPAEIAQIEELKTTLAASQEPQAVACERIARLFEQELRLRRWQQMNGFPACQGCGDPAQSLYGEARLCSSCFFG